MRQPERRLQIACANHLRQILSPNIFWTARDLSTSSVTEGENKKAMGCRAGLSDMEIWLVGPKRRLHLELKAAKSHKAAWNRLSEAQLAMVPIIQSYGEAFEVIWSVQSLEAALTRHGIPWTQPPLKLTGEQRDIALAGRVVPKGAKVRAVARKPGGYRRVSAARMRKVRAIRQHVMF